MPRRFQVLVPVDDGESPAKVGAARDQAEVVWGLREGDRAAPCFEYRAGVQWEMGDGDEAFR